MTTRRLPHTAASPSRTSGDDRPRGNCYGLAAATYPDPTPFDVLTDGTQGEGQSRKIRAAKAEVLSERLCGGCPLRDAGCWSSERDEPWMLALRGKPVPRHTKPKVADDAA